MPQTQGRGTAFESVLLGPADQTPRRLRVRVQALLTVMLLATHLMGLGVAVVLSVLVVFPATSMTRASAVGLAIAIPSYALVAGVLGGSWATLSALRSLRWLNRGTEPTPADRRATLRLPWRLTVIQAGVWVGALVVFTLLAAILQPERVLGTFFIVGIAGLVVSAVGFLLCEFGLRPVAARVLSGELRDIRVLVGVRRRVVLFWAIGTGAPVTGLIVSAVVFLAGDQLTSVRFAVIVLTLAAVVLVFGLLVIVLAIRAVVAPVTSVRRAMLRVGEGDLDAEIPVYDGTELGMLQAGFNEMVRGLRERERLRDVFGRHVGREVAAAAAEGDLELGGRTCTVSVLFVDLVGSTSYAADRDAGEVVATLNRFFAVVVAEVAAERGLVNKFMGDAVLAVFGAPAELPDHAGAALRAGRRIGARLLAELPEVSAGIGIATGPAVAGNVGEESRYEYTVIGDSVNSAARLCELAKDPPQPREEGAPMLLAGWSSVEQAPVAERSHWRRAGAVTLRGRQAETPLGTVAAPLSGDR